MALTFFFLFIETETWLSAQGDEVKTVELAPSGFDVKSFQLQSRSRGGRIATPYKSTLGSNITFKINFDFAHTVRSSAGIHYFTAQRTTFFSVCATLRQTDEIIQLTLCLLNS